MLTYVTASLVELQRRVKLYNFHRIVSILDEARKVSVGTLHELRLGSGSGSGYKNELGTPLSRLPSVFWTLKLQSSSGAFLFANQNISFF